MTDVSIYDNIKTNNLIFYKKIDGTKPAGEFIKTLTTDMKAKVVRDIIYLKNTVLI